MFPPISPDDLATLIDEAAIAARRLHHQCRMAPRRRMKAETSVAASGRLR